MQEESDLQYLYESHENFSALPTFAIIPGLMATMSSSIITEAIPGKEFDLSQVKISNPILYFPEFFNLFDIFLRFMNKV